MLTFQKYLNESANSDQYEKNVADYINTLEGINAERPRVSAKYADVKLERDGNTTWLEVKMNHTDNLSNPRIFFDGNKWDTTYNTPAAKFAVKHINKSKQAKDFIDSIAKFSGIKKPKIPTTKSGLKDSNAIPLDVMKEYFSQPGVNRYIMSMENVDLGKLVTDHYLLGKAEPAQYMQAADDFYMIGKTNPLKVPNNVPVLSGAGPFRIRIATRSQFYEVQAEVKITQMPSSKYSLMPASKKKNPFA
jgi:hypothetical protein